MCEALTKVTISSYKATIRYVVPLIGNNTSTYPHIDRTLTIFLQNLPLPSEGNTAFHCVNVLQSFAKYN